MTINMAVHACKNYPCAQTNKGTLTNVINLYSAIMKASDLDFLSHIQIFDHL